MILIFDIDDTIYYKNDERLTRKIHTELIRISKNHKIYLATQRHHYNLGPVERLINESIVTDVICGNGAYTLYGETRKECCINYEFIKALEGCEYIAIAQNGIYQLGSSHWGLATFYCKNFVNSIEELKNINSIVIKSEKNDTLEQVILNSGLKYRFDNRYKSYNVTTVDCNKLSMINSLNFEEFYGFGNDIDYDYPFIEAAIEGRLITKSNYREDKKITPAMFLRYLINFHD